MASSSRDPVGPLKNPPDRERAVDDDEPAPVEIIHVTDKGIPGDGRPSSHASASTSSPEHAHGRVEFIHGEDGGVESYPGSAAHPPADERATMRAMLRRKRQGCLAYVKTREFWLVLLLGQILSLCLTSTNTFTQLLVQEGCSIPAFQTLFNYVLLNLIYTPYTIHRYGWKGFGELLYHKGWRYFILAFFDACGNYFLVLAYQYTSILSAQLINFFAIVVVVVISLTFLGVRYRITQYVGILICVGGMGILLASDHLNGSDIADAPDQLKGDLFALAGATFYGLSNVGSEFLVSKAPIYEVVGQLAFWAMPIMGVICAIFDRADFQTATWDSAVAGYLTGYTLILSLFYTLAPLLFRLASAAFFNISLLTANFWGVIIGIQVFHLTVHWMYPIAFVLILVGLVIYFLTEGDLGEAHKPWLGADQAAGVSGLGTAKRKAERHRGAPAASVV